jgi:hypothetical protein
MNVTLQIPALDQLTANVAQLVAINKQRFAFEQKNMIQASDVTKLIGLYDALVTTDAADQAATAAVQAKLDALTASVAEFNDPALQTALTAALANAVAVVPPPDPVPVPVPDPTPVPDPVPAPALFDPTVSYAAGAVVSDSTGAVWTAVTPLLGEAPGVTAGNWTLTTPAPVATS